jgi:hypothetical protein
MAAGREYRWDFINPGTTVGVYIHGYANNEAVAYSAVVYALAGGGVVPLGHINKTEGEVFRHVDNTIARTIYVENRAPFNPCEVDLNIIAESY